MSEKNIIVSHDMRAAVEIEAARLRGRTWGVRFRLRPALGEKQNRWWWRSQTHRRRELAEKAAKAAAASFSALLAQKPDGDPAAGADADPERLDALADFATSLYAKHLAKALDSFDALVQGALKYAAPAAEEAPADPKLMVTRFLYEEGDVAVSVERTSRTEDVWAIRCGGMAYNRRGRWEHERQPSSRTELFLSRARWSLEEARGALTEAVAKAKKDGLVGGMTR